MRRPLFSILIGLLVVLAAGGCSRVQGPRTWAMTAEPAQGGAPLRIVVNDLSGRVLDVQFEPPAAAGDRPVNAPGQPDVIIVGWTGGACDTNNELSVEQSDSGLAVTVRIEERPGDCDAIGIGRAVALRLDGPVLADRVSVTTLR